jgi:leucyl aminopeptidase
MQYTLEPSSSVSTNKNDCIVVPVYTTKNKKLDLHGATKQLDESSNGAITEFTNTGDFKASLEQTQMLYKISGISSPRVLLVGCG